MNLAELATKEKAINTTVSSLTGTAEERLQVLERLGIFEQYNDVYSGYAALHGNDGEAFKRALFLSWYGFIENPAYSGIKNLNKEAQEEVMNTLLLKLKKGRPDYELRWMLTHYTTAKAYFEQFESAAGLLAKVKEYRIELPSAIDKNSMETRGLMGTFWNFFFYFS